jgi:hypothetical protein
MAAAATAGQTRREYDVRIAAAQTVLLHASSCVEPPGTCAVFGARCASARSMMSHLRVCSAACTAGSPSHFYELVKVARDHAARCSLPPSAACRMPDCDKYRRFAAALREQLQPLTFDLEDVTDPEHCRHEPIPFAGLARYASGPHLETVTCETRVRLAGAPREHGVPLFAFLETRAAMPGLEAAAPLTKQTGGRLVPGTCTHEELEGLRLCAYAADGDFEPIAEALVAADDALESGDAEPCCLVRRVVVALSDAMQAADAAGVGAARRAALQRSTLLRVLASCLRQFQGCGPLQDMAASGVVLCLSGEAPGASAARQHMLEVWLSSSLANLAANKHPARSKYDAAEWYDRRWKLVLRQMRAVNELAVAQPERRMALLHGIGTSAIEITLHDCSCDRARCSSMAASGLAVRQVARALGAEPSLMTHPAGVHFLTAIAALLAKKPGMLRWACTYALLPMARAERVQAAGPERAACRLPCCAAAAAAPQTLAALAAQPGALEALGQAARRAPLARRAAAVTLAALLGRDPAAAKAAHAVAPGLQDALAAALGCARAAASRPAAQQQQQRRRRRMAALTDQTEPRKAPSPCGSLNEPGGCDSDCGNVSDEDEDGASLPFTAAALAALCSAATGAPLPPLPPHRPAAPDADAVAAALLAEEEAEAAAARKQPKASSGKKKKAKKGGGGGVPDLVEGTVALTLDASGGAAAASSCREACCAQAPFSLRPRTHRAAQPPPPPPASAPDDADDEAAPVADALSALFPHLFPMSSRPSRDAELDEDNSLPLRADVMEDPDDALCVCCLDAARDTPLAACAAVHAPVLCGPCAARIATLGARPSCPWCSTPIAD